MRTETVYVTTRYQAAKSCPWAAKIARVESGFRCFESVSDYDTWKNQR